MKSLVTTLCLLALCCTVGADRRRLLLLTSAAGGAEPSFPSANVQFAWHFEEAAGNARVDVVASSDMPESDGTVARGTGKQNFCAEWNNMISGQLAWTLGFGDISAVMSLAFWLYIDNAPSGNPTLFTGNSESDPYLKLNSSRQLVFGSELDGDTFTSAALPLDSWHLVVLVFVDANDRAVYTNGVLAATWEDGGNPDGSQIFWGVTSGDLDCGIDELTIWSQPLSVSDVQAIWNSGTGRFYSP